MEFSSRNNPHTLPNNPRKLYPIDLCTTSLVRQYFPKKSNLTTYSDEDIQYVEDQLNNRPRKVLGYRTPKEVILGMQWPQKIALHC
jgi:hypothetical protein